MRAERELAELRTDVVAANALIAAVRGRISAFLPDGTQVDTVRGALAVSVEPPGLKNCGLALSNPARTIAPSSGACAIQDRGAATRRLRIPDPQVAAGVKRADVTSGVAPNPFSEVTRTGVISASAAARVQQRTL
jgi:hypothetical protein